MLLFPSVFPIFLLKIKIKASHQGLFFGKIQCPFILYLWIEPLRPLKWVQMMKKSNRSSDETFIMFEKRKAKDSSRIGGNFPFLAVQRGLKCSNHKTQANKSVLRKNFYIMIFKRKLIKNMEKNQVLCHFHPFSGLT